MENELDRQGPDYVASVARAVLGGVPIAGSLLTELVDQVVPRQRVERLVDYAKQLGKRLESVESLAKRQLQANDAFAELLEESMRQAARSLSEERRQYLASLVRNSLDPDGISHEESRHLMRILGELNDIEIIWLQLFAYSSRRKIDAFRERHREIIQPLSRTAGQPQEAIDKASLQDSYKAHLAQLGLLEPHADQSRRPRSLGSRYQITSLGRLLLRQIGTDSNDDA